MTAVNAIPDLKPALMRPDQMPSVDRGGGNRTIPLVGRGTGSQQMLTGMTIIGPGSAIPWHFHNCEETVLVLEGEGFAEVGDEVHPVKPMDATWIPCNLPHRFRNGSSEKPLKIFWVYASIDATRTMLETGETRPVSAEHAKKSS
ncbi:cupin domain-containing protein [Xanthobacter sp. YC-JY1]|uniref:cupin domain-containing protein n=1 Tax=Xanthobacter sp. YC-JY1 TaxID=2419844 RepID=UPI001F24C5DF|nr:cupin domain-containing protein [Xanthobacter sp. YC-JY1]UJX46190.1 cupin domain-containing protein [Xanthobacter sp. YC-JY1]